MRHAPGAIEAHYRPKGEFDMSEAREEAEERCYGLVQQDLAEVVAWRALESDDDPVRELI
jgi:hypothetical protein